MKTIKSYSIALCDGSYTDFSRAGLRIVIFITIKAPNDCHRTEQDKTISKINK